MDSVSIRIPAFPEYVKVVRLVAAGLAARLGFTLEDIDDLKIAVDELCAYLTGSQGRDGELDVRFRLGEDRIEIEGHAAIAPGHKIRSDLTEFSRMILTTVVDSASLTQRDGAPRFELLKIKRR